MAPNVNRLTQIPEDKLVDTIRHAQDLDEPDIITAFRDGSDTFTVDTTIIVADTPTGISGTPITKEGKMSVFGGPDDRFIKPDANLALFFNNPSDAVANTDIFLSEQPAETTGLARRLNPEAHYIACRWDYTVTPKDFLRRIKVKVSAN